MSVVRVRSGIVPVSLDEATALAASMEALEFAVVRLELDRVESTREVLDRVSTALGFPDYFGKNWDALADCLASLDFEGSAGMLVVLSGIDRWRDRDPKSVATFLEILDEASVDYAVHGRVLAFALVSESTPRS